MEASLFVFGVMITIWGLLMVWKPYRISRFEEQLDAIGSKRRLSKVEPAEWKVKITRRGGLFVVLIGLWVVALGLDT
ncbi:hypothetical protein [Halapricum desulfuricans]|nr:hypothetical protein [Halapricum desulfuricans]